MIGGCFFRLPFHVIWDFVWRWLRGRFWIQNVHLEAWMSRVWVSRVWESSVLGSRGWGCTGFGLPDLGLGSQVNLIFLLDESSNTLWKQWVTQGSVRLWRQPHIVIWSCIYLFHWKLELFPQRNMNYLMQNISFWNNAVRHARKFMHAARNMCVIKAPPSVS